MNVRQLRAKLLEDYPNFGSVINGIKFTVKDEPRLKHLCVHTDGREIFINKSTFSQLPSAAQFFHIAKNVCHIAFRHIERGEDKEDKKLWSIAASAVVNQLLAADGHEIPEGMVKIKNAQKFSVEEVYKKLVQKNVNSNNFNTEDYNKWYPPMKRMKKFVKDMFDGKDKKQTLDQLHPQQEKNNGQKGDKQQGEEEQGGEGDHWQKHLDEMQKQMDSNQQGKGGQKENEQDMDERSFKKQEQWQKQLGDMEREMEGGTDAGSGAGNKYLRLGEMGKGEKIVNWKSLLRAALETDEDCWGYRFSTKANNWRARIEDVEIDERILTEVVVDTSGSVSDDLLHSFLSQLKVLIQDSDLKVGCFDDKFYGFDEIKSGKDIDNFTIKGRGGTNFDIAVGAFSKHADNKIVFTDGYADMPSEKVKAIWIVYGDEKIEPDGGTVIMASTSQIMGNKDKDLIK